MKTKIEELRTSTEANAKSADRMDQFQAKHRLAVLLFLLSLAVPLIFSLGTIRLSIYRLVLLIVFLPTLVMYIRGSAGKIRAADFFVALFVFWITLSELVHRGSSGVETIGISILEILGSFLLGRVLIRTPVQFLFIAKWLFVIAIVLLPFSVYELLTGTNAYLEMWQTIGSTNPDILKESRLGLDRVQGPMDHPILFGVFIVPVIGVTWFGVCQSSSVLIRVLGTLLVTFVGFLSLSSGPISAMVLEIALIAWFVTFRRVSGSWWILLGIFLLGYITVDLISNRTPIEVAISYLAFDANTGLGRIMIWEWGWVNIFGSPVFGIGPETEWVRHEHLTESFDMFWLFFMMTYGVPAGIGQIGSYLAALIPIIFHVILDKRLFGLRMGWVTATFGIMISGWMVHFWNAPLALYFFILGSGIWLLDWKPETTTKSESTTKPVGRKKVQYSRFQNGLDY